MIIDNDVAVRAIEWAMNGLERRSQVIADNVANAEVPGFRARRVDFESELREAIGRGRFDVMPDPLVSPTSDAAGANGNNVRLEDELVSLMETNLRRTAMIQSFNYKANLLRSVIRIPS